MRAGMACFPFVFVVVEAVFDECTGYVNHFGVYTLEGVIAMLRLPSSCFIATCFRCISDAFRLEKSYIQFECTRVGLCRGVVCENMIIGAYFASLISVYVLSAL